VVPKVTVVVLHYDILLIDGVLTCLVDYCIVKVCDVPVQLTPPFVNEGVIVIVAVTGKSCVGCCKR